MKTLLLFVLLLATVATAEVRVIMWETSNPEKCSDVFYSLTDVNAVGTMKPLNLVPFQVSKIGTNRTMGAILDMPKGIHYIWGFSTMGSLVSTQSAVLCITNIHESIVIVGADAVNKVITIKVK